MWLSETHSSSLASEETVAVLVNVPICAVGSVRATIVTSLTSSEGHEDDGWYDEKL